MAKVKIHRELPDCELVKELERKAERRTDIGFDFLGTLDRFRDQVSGEVRHINQLFPEYTPHDEQYHLKRLFHVADTVLGKNLMEEMNSAELLVLGLGLYGHDWGMAVSEAEKEFILTGKLPQGVGRDGFCLLPNESARLLRFARDTRVELDEDGRPSRMPIESWREYLRETHADRSAERVRRFFEPIDGGVADAGARVCAGHQMGFEELRDDHAYPVNFSVLRQPVNLRALAIYVRLADLLDLAEDRTPYVIWKFVAPRDSRSKLEWNKHRALREVTCSEYQAGRIVVVDGSTDDHEVFAALEDLHGWCDAQLRGCMDLLAQMKDPRHGLDLRHIEWRVAARGFEPVSIQFEFDRDQMFEILSDEIYQGDPYVFLRELLQNSIDAIRMRREVLRRKGIEPGDLGVMRVAVHHGDAGDALVTWQDDGIGMDEYVVRNYLAVAGKSYYRSVDFEREGLEMDPISRFGIGLLSCFMVANRVEIETYRDPYLATTSDPLSITIPDLRHQFRIEKHPKESGVVGTTVRVFVRGDRLPRDEGGAVQPLDATEYLTIIAGFVDFPILISEGDRKTIILHPRVGAKEALERLQLAGEWHVQQLDLRYPWSEVILPQDLSIASEVLREERWDLADDLQLDGYAGVLTYLVPGDQRGDVGHAVGYGDEVRTSLWVRGDDGIPRKEQIRWARHDTGDNVAATGLSPSCSHPQSYAVYRDGILLPRATAPSLWLRESLAPLPPQSYVVNLPKSIAPTIDLARTALIPRDQPWDAPIFQAHLSRLCEAHVENLLALEPGERLYQLGRIVAFHRIPVQDLWNSFPHDQWPIAFLHPEGVLQVVNWEDVAPGVIYCVPEFIRRQLGELAICQWLTQVEYHGPLLHWRGERCEAMTALGGFLSAALGGCAAMFYVAAWDSYVSDGCRFLSGPWGNEPPLLQWCWRPIDEREPPAVEDVLEKATRDPTALSPLEARVLRSYLADEDPFLTLRWAEFPAPFDKYFGYAHRVVNVTHPATLALVRLMAAIGLARARRTVLPEGLGELTDAFHEAMRMMGSALAAPGQWSRAVEALWSTARQYALLDPTAADHPVPGPDEFVPGIGRLGALEEEWSTAREIQPFGELLL